MLRGLREPSGAIGWSIGVEREGFGLRNIDHRAWRAGAGGRPHVPFVASIHAVSSGYDRPMQSRSVRRDPRRWVLWGVGALGLVALVAGLAVGRSERWDMTCARPFAAPIEHLGRCDRGTRVAVSSVASDLQSHALFLIDGRVGGLLEKWMTQLRDPSPWLELSWDAPRIVSQVAVDHAGQREHEAYDTVDFDVSVMVPGASAWEVVARVRDNTSARTVSELAPRAIIGLRIDVLRAGRVDARVRIYEVEVRGPANGSDGGLE